MIRLTYEVESNIIKDALQCGMSLDNGGPFLLFKDCQKAVDLEVPVHADPY